MLFVRAYPRETQEMVFDAHNRAFAFFKGSCTRGIYDNMKTAVETVFIGKDRQTRRPQTRRSPSRPFRPNAAPFHLKFNGALFRPIFTGVAPHHEQIVRERRLTPTLG